MTIPTQPTEKPTPETLALVLRTALAELRTVVSNDAFYDDKNKRKFKFDAIESMLDEHFPDWSPYEKAFLSALSHNGIDNGPRFLRLHDKAEGIDTIENGSQLYDHWVTFDIGMAFGRGDKT